MARRKTPTFTEVELEFMQVIWMTEEITSDEIQRILSDKGRPLAAGSIRNVLVIMLKKGYVTRKKQGKTYFYKAKVQKDHAAQTMVQDILTRVFDGSKQHLVTSILNSDDIRIGELEEIELLIAERKREVQK